MKENHAPKVPVPVTLKCKNVCGCNINFVQIIIQNHRMVKVGRDVWRSSSPTLAQAGSP